MCFIFNIYDAFFISKKTVGFLWITVLNLSIMHAWGANVLLLFLEFKGFLCVILYVIRALWGLFIVILGTNFTVIVSPLIITYQILL